MKNLTASQCAFITALSQGKAPTRQPRNRTAICLERLGLVRWALLVGWTLTPDGIQYSKTLTNQGGTK